MSGVGKGGVFLCPNGNGHLARSDWEKLQEFAQGLPGIEVVARYEEGRTTVQHLVATIERHQLDRIVLAGNQPGYYFSAFATAMAEAGRNPEEIFLAAFDEYGVRDESLPHARAVVAAAASGAGYGKVAHGGEVEVRSETLVIGGGIAGIQAALEIANADEKVILVEKSGTIGGHMAMFDKTFPTLDCAACILTPKMVEVGQHSNIELLTLSRVVSIDGRPGNFRVTIEKKARKVREADCIGCGICAEKCPKRVASEFDAGTGMRRAAYIPFPQAVPNKYLIDSENCLYAQTGKCQICVKNCPTGCIDLDEKDVQLVLEVGNIIVATGIKTFDAAKAENFGYGKLDNVITALEFERLVNAAGPTGGALTMPARDKKGNRIFVQDGPVPESVAIIHCVGSRDVNHNSWCSRVCCMYSLKFAHLVKEKLPDAEVFEYYIDMRAFGKGYEEFYDRIRREGIYVVRGRTATAEKKGERVLLRTEDIVNSRLIEQEVDMVVLAVGLEPREDAADLAALLGIPVDGNHWLVERRRTAVGSETSRPGIHMAGACQGPKDIPDTVAQASAAAARVLQSIVLGRAMGGLGHLYIGGEQKKGTPGAPLKTPEGGGHHG